ncbi:MAG: hypothetical protein FRX49_02784 [Trebouxia sp. A1-2]|nr:MAG: hypothetical protein FRX49_02784 [Trebouxia sp. A1-2]
MVIMRFLRMQQPAAAKGHTWPLRLELVGWKGCLAQQAVSSSAWQQMEDSPCDAAVTAASGEVCRLSSSISKRLVTCTHFVIHWGPCKQDSFEKVQAG